MADEQMEKIKAHVAACSVCSSANKRVNDFCDEGRLMFYAWANVHPPERITVAEITKEQHHRLVEETRHKQRSGERN
jgi:hypothetical protein